MKKILVLKITALLAAVILIQTAQAQPIPEDESAAVILAYFRVGDDTATEGNISSALFRSHMDFLTAGPYNIVSLDELIGKLKAGEKLPPFTVAITFEGAYSSALQNAYPLLIERNLPFTVFYSAMQADGKNAEYLHWKDLQNLARNKNVTLGVMPLTYDSLLTLPPAEIKRQINKSRQIHRETFSSDARFFSYPYGQYNALIRQDVQNKGFEAAFGQQSGAVYAGADFYALPRFTLTERYGDLERFEMIAGALPLPVSDIEPQDPVFRQSNPAIGFSVTENLQPRLGLLSCYVSGQSQPDIEILGRRVEVRLQETAPEDRVRLNCTLPGPDRIYESDPQRWRWFGLLLSNQIPLPAAPALNQQPAVLP